MSFLQLDRVYHGYWVDHSKGSILGATITTQSDTANIVVALLSIVITLAGSFLWNIIAFGYFAVYAVPEPRDGLHHQRQILLRNTASPAAIFFKTIKLSWRNRAMNNQSFLRLFHLTLIAAICGVGFLVAGVLSSLVVSSSDLAVLARSNSCGFRNLTLDDAKLSSKEYLVLSNTYDGVLADRTVKYVRDCFNTTQGDPSCQIYGPQRVSIGAEYTSCPVQDDLCKLKQDPALLLDTGLLYSNDVFGINAKHNDALAVRYVVTCAPVDLSRYQEVSNLTESESSELFSRPGLPGEQLIKWYLGKRTGYPFNYTHAISSYTTNTTNGYETFAADSYEEIPDPFEGVNNYRLDNPFRPIPALAVKEADLELLGIALNNVQSAYPCNDPVYSFHRQTTQIFPILLSNGSEVKETTFYSADEPMGWIGCKKQYQFCLPDGNCTSLGSHLTTATQGLNLTLNPHQNITFSAFMSAIRNTYGMSLMDRISDALAVSDAKYSWEIPSNMWEIEVKRWFTMMIAWHQQVIASIGAGLGPGYDSLPKDKEHPYQDILCKSQLLKAPDGVSNLSVLGLALILAFSGLVIISASLLPLILQALSRSKHRDLAFAKQWEQEELLQFQRTAYESNGVGLWSGKQNQTPLAVSGEHFLNLSSALSAHQGPNVEPTSKTVTSSQTSSSISSCSTSGLDRSKPAVSMRSMRMVQPSQTLQEIQTSSLIVSMPQTAQSAQANQAPQTGLTTQRSQTTPPVQTTRSSQTT